LDTIIFEAKRVAGLIESMKNTTIGTEEAAQRTALDLGVLVTQTAELYRHILEREGVEFKLHIDDNLPKVWANPEELTQVLFNLLQNAKTHTQSGTIALTVRSDGENVEVLVVDTGTGIPPELLDHVFERGVHDTSSSSGIGLAICKKILDAHEGTLEIASEQGKGTKASFSLRSL
jgi:signal transduction histidine kinase